MSFGLFDTLTNDSPISQHSLFSDALNGRFSPLFHLRVGSRPANLQMCPTVGAFSMSILASNPAEITGPMPVMFRLHSPIGCAADHLSRTARIWFSSVSICTTSHETTSLGSWPFDNAWY